MNKQEWLRYARRAGLEGFEINQTTSTSRELSWFEGAVNTFVTSKQTSTAMRGVKDGKIVSIALEKVSDRDMEHIFHLLKEQAQYVSETEKDELVPEMDNQETLPLHTWVRPSMDKVEEVLARMEKKFLEHPEVTMVNEMQWEDAQSKMSIINSLGLSVKEKTTFQLLVAQITMARDGEIRDGYEVAVVEDLHTFDEDAFIDRLVTKVAAQLGARSLSSRVCPVIFDNRAMTTLFGCFSSAFYGSLIAKGISPLRDKLGQSIFSDKITVLDSPRNQEALTLRNYDDEGHPTFSKIVVNKGVFETILHNTKSALKMNAESTGNGFSKGGGATDVSSCNMYIMPGKKNLSQLEEEMGNGVEITELNGMHAGVDFVSGNFSLQAKGWLIENGKRTRPLTLFTVAGNFFSLMNEVVAVGNDLDWSYHSLACPSILFRQASISGNQTE